MSRIKPDWVLTRFLASTGPAAIATRLVASLLPMVKRGVPLPIGAASVLAVYGASRLVVLAMLAGSVGYGLAVWLL